MTLPQSRKNNKDRFASDNKKAPLMTEIRKKTTRISNSQLNGILTATATAVAQNSKMTPQRSSDFTARDSNVFLFHDRKTTDEKNQEKQLIPLRNLKIQ